MRKIVPCLIGLCIALWSGGLVALFTFVSFLFSNDRGMAVNVAPMLFHVFERYQLMLAAIALACTVVWRIYACSRPKRVLLFALLAATALAIVEFLVITPRINQLRNTDQAASEDFKRLHGYAMYLYVGTTLCTIAAGAAFIAAVKREPVDYRKSPESAPA